PNALWATLEPFDCWELGVTSIRPQYWTVIADNVGIPVLPGNSHAIDSQAPAFPSCHDLAVHIEYRSRGEWDLASLDLPHAQTVHTIVSQPRSAVSNQKFRTTLALKCRNHDLLVGPV